MSQIANEGGALSQCTESHSEKQPYIDHVRLTADECQILGRARIAKSAAGALGRADLIAEVPRLDPAHSGFLYRNLKLPASAPPAKIAVAVQARLARANDEQAAYILHDFFHESITATIATSTLAESQLTAILSADPDGLIDALGSVDQSWRDAGLFDIEVFGSTPAARVALWSSMVVTGHAGDVAALAWLLADPPPFWSTTQTDAARQAWQSVRERYPSLPELPTPLAVLVEMSSELGDYDYPDDPKALDIGSEQAGAPQSDDMSGGAAAAAPESTAAGLTEHLTAEAAEELRTGKNPTLLADWISVGERIEQERQTIAAVVLPDLTTAVARGVPSEATDIARIMEFFVNLRELLAAATTVADQTPADLDTARAALQQAQHAVAEADAAAEKIERVQRLMASAGYEFLAADIAQVQALAGEVTADSDTDTVRALLALLELIELAGRNPERAHELDRVIRATLPAAIPLLSFANVPGAFVLGDTTVPGTSAKPPDAYAPTPAAIAAPHDDNGAGNDAAAADGGATSDDNSAADDTAADGHGQRTERLEDVLAELDFVVPQSNSAQRAPRARTVPPSDLDTAGPQSSNSTSLYTALLRSGELALAYWLTVAENGGTSFRAAHRLAALAAAMKTSTGSNAAEFAATITDLEPSDLKDHPGLQMLVYGASVRAGLLSPIAGASDPLRASATSVVRSGDAVGKLTELLQAAIYAGVYLTPRNANAVIEASETTSEYEAFAHEAAAKLRNAPSRTIKYGPATELWQSWMAPEDGYLGVPLRIVTSPAPSPENLEFVRTRVAELRTPRSLEQALDRAATHNRSRKRNTKRIEAQARIKLLDWAGDVTELLARWVTATENMLSSGGGTWMTDPIADLQNSVAAVRKPALAELAELCGSGDEARDAATDAGLTLLKNALDLLMGTEVIDGPETSSARTLNGLLTLAPAVELLPSIEPRRPPAATDIQTAFDALRNGENGWIATFNARTERHDQLGTQLLIETLRPDNPRLAQQLSGEREAAIAASIAQVDHNAAALAARIDTDRLYGRLTADTWTDLSTRARACQTPHRGARSDFDVVLDRIGKIEIDRAEAVKSAITAARIALDTAGMPLDAADRIQQCIDKGDLTTAAEYEVTIRDNGQLPARNDTTDHLSLFLKAFPDRFAVPRPEVEAGGHPVLAQLRSALNAGASTGDLATGELADMLISAGIELGQVGRGSTAVVRIDQWTQLAQARSYESRIGNVRSILGQVGFQFDKATTPPARRGHSGRRGRWLDLHGVRPTSGSALLPAFGSAMSPSGDSLRLLGIWHRPTPGELVETLRDEPNDHSVMVFYFGTLDSLARRELAGLFRRDRRLPTTIVIDDAAFAYLSCQPEPSREITMSALLPFTVSSPFAPDIPGASIRQEMFYGRNEERAKIIDMMGPCIVYGGRQLGKSALLLQAARQFDDQSDRIAIYESIFKIGRAVSVEAVWTTLWPLLARREIVPADIPAGDVAGALTKYVADWITSRPGRQLLLLLDESDKFLDGDAEAVNGRFTHVTHFKELMERTGRAVKVVFAGLHQTARFDRLANHPLAHFGEPVCVGPLAPQAAYDLLTSPLRALGYHFDDPDHAARVLALANNQPALIQLFAAHLLRNLQAAPMPEDAPPQTVHADDVEHVWADANLRRSFRKRFDWTLDLDPRYKIIAYSVALHAHARSIDATMTPSELRNECETWWPTGFSAEGVRAGEFRALLDECVDLGVLSYTTHGYRLRTPNVLDLLGAREEVEAVLDQAESIELPESFDGSMMRPEFGGGPTRGPLTSQQIADLLAPRSQVRYVIGSPALTVERCLRALQDENARAVSGQRGGHVREANPATLAKQCQQGMLMAAGRHVIVLVNLKTASRDVAWATWKQARELIATHSGGTLGIVLVSGPAQASTWPAAARAADISSGLTELRRYDRTDLRLWLTETPLPFQDNAARDELLAVTGGWPVLLNKIAEDLTDHGSGLRSDPLRQIRTRLQDSERCRELVEASGVRSDATLSQAWDFLVQTCAQDRADLDTLAEYLTLHGEDEDGSNALAPTAVAAAGYASTADVIEVLRGLGVLIGLGEDGRFKLEPVMVAATKRAHR
ncbi:hypothetical protein ACFXO7_00880 [Nocardia tengchongensis]|uniref:hypothetical protein n=1 Tax=Nocardia tengchongensis TaxID=2055889 RepID=UPI003692CC11